MWITAAKNDPRKKGRELDVPRLPKGSPSVQLCAATALEHWLEVVGAVFGAIFRTFELREGLTTQRLDLRDVAHSATARGSRGRCRRFRRAFVATRIHYEGCKEEDFDRGHQACYRAAVEWDRARLRRGCDP